MQTKPTRDLTRRQVLASGTAAAALGVLPRSLHSARFAADASAGLRLGLVTYLWGQHMGLDELIASCAASGVLGVETRTTHAHGVEPKLGAKQRAEVRARFDDSPVTFVGPGSNEWYHHGDPDRLRQAIERSKAFLQLSHDCGGSGVKVKPDNRVPNKSLEESYEQIGASLNELGAFADELGQEVRLEVHGGMSELAHIAAIMEVADHPRVGVCWNCNSQDLLDPGLDANFALVRDRFGATVHVRELDVGEYPYTRLMELLVRSEYSGWVLLEARTNPQDKVQALKEQKELFDQLVARARG